MINIPDQKWIVDKFGEDQYNIAMEECAELIQAINKHIRMCSEESREHLVEEMADVSICLEQLKKLAFVTDDELQQMIDKKSKRTVERYGN